MQCCIKQMPTMSNCCLKSILVTTLMVLLNITMEEVGLMLSHHHTAVLEKWRWVT